jgi:ketosteroid isomerase-like protein
MAQERMVSNTSGEDALALRPAQSVRGELPPGARPGTRVVVEWFAALSEGRIADAMTLMEPGGPYFLLRQRRTITNADFGEIMRGLIGTTFTRAIAWSLGLITEQDDRVAVVAGSYVPLTAGGTYENLYHFLFRIRNGLIAEGFEFGDTLRSAQTFAKPPGQD